MPDKKRRWTEGMVYSLLSKRFQEPAFVLLPQVRNGTGFSRKRDRTVDAIAVSVWPSRGLSISGIEIKTSRSDWRKELSDPQKSSDFMQYCDHWYVAAPKGVVDEGEVPDTWGYLECPSVNSIRTTIGAKKLDARPVDMLLLCSILRKASECMTPTESVSQQVDSLIEKRLEKSKIKSDFELGRLRDTITAFEDASGVSLGESWDAGRIGESVKFIRECGVDNARGSVRRLRDDAQRVADRLTNALELHVESVMPEVEFSPNVQTCSPNSTHPTID